VNARPIPTSTSRRAAPALLGAALVLLAAVPAPAAAQRWTLPDSTQRQVDEVFSFVERDAPGCALGVARDGKLAYGRGYGLANLDWGIPLTTSTVFDIGSTSKQFTSTALALLEMDGILSLDDEVRKWIPELPDYGSPITIRHLLNHTSGIRDYLTLMSLAGFEFANVFDEMDGVELITRQKALNFEPGSEYLYSNSGYLLLANIVRRATGRSLREFLEARVFDPLGMAGTTIWDDNTEILHERATGYAPSDQGWGIDHAWNFQMGGDGQVITSVEDLLKWDRNFYVPEVGGQGLLDRLHTRGVLNDGDTIAYALGLTLDEYRGLRRVQHGGAWAGFRAMLARYPDRHTSVIVLCNRADASPGAYADRVADAVLSPHFPEAMPEEAEVNETGEPVSLSASQLQHWAGLYRHPDRPDYLRMEVSEGKLAVRQEEESYPLSPRSENVFVLELTGQRLTFSTVDGRDRVQSGSTVLERVQAPELSPAELAAYQGLYHSEELDATFELRMESGRLWLHRPNRGPAALYPGVTDEFEAGGFGLTLLREAGELTGLSVFAGRVTGIVFERRRAEG
jgi:CubicO group peptidase (beta-lactamase class C family)